MPKHVIDNCGCDPVQLELERRLDQTHLKETIKTSTRSCATGTLGAAKSTTAQAAYVVTCVEKTVVVDPDIRASLIKLVDDSTSGALANDAGKARVATYAACYRKWISSGNYAAVLQKRNEMARTFASLLLDSFLCNWMRIGVEMANRGCGAAAGEPCAPGALLGLYGLRVGDIVTRQHQGLCDGFQKGAATFLTQVPNASQFCVTQTPWLAARSNVVYADVLMETNGRDSTDQVGLLKDLLYRRIPPGSRNTAVQDIIDAWPTLNASSLGVAKQKWSDIKAQCGATPCDVQIGGETVSSSASWDDVQRVLFEAWLDFFSSTKVEGMHLGCAKDSMTWDQGNWQYRNGATCRQSAGVCFAFDAPKGVGAGVAAFVDSLGGP